jgi:hypothetical protein
MDSSAAHASGTQMGTNILEVDLQARSTREGTQEGFSVKELLGGGA